MLFALNEIWAVCLFVCASCLLATDAFSLTDQNFEAKKRWFREFDDCGLRPSWRKHKNCTRISGGFDALPGDYPAFVHLQIEGIVRSNTCGGTILGPTIVLTASHCLIQARKILLKPTMLRPEGKPASEEAGWYEAKRWCIHPKASRLTFDVAVLILERPIKFDGLTQSACLPLADLSSKRQAFAVGLGLVSGPTMPLVTNKLQVLPVKRARCDLHEAHRTQICFKSSEPNHVGDTCLGDSGGPIFAMEEGRLTLFGVTSFGPDTCMTGTTGVSTNANIYNLKSDIYKLIDRCIN